jgi:hypothetical protein
MPAKHKDGTFSTYKVLVNGSFVGNIVPQKGNWQAISLDNTKTVRLRKGDNIISVVTEIPEVPAVEFVKLAKNSAKAVISSSNYDTYLNKCKSTANMSKDDNSFSLYGDTLSNALMTMSTSTSVWYGLPIAYTFYTKVQFYAGQEIFITSASKNLHFIEFFNVDRPQYLSWVHRSEYAVNEGNYIATVRVTIPQDGYYYLRTRTFKNTSYSTAHVNINGTYYYENAPLYTCGVIMGQGGDNKYYATYTKNTNTDPFMWIEGAAERIVAYNDDVKSSDASYASQYGVTGRNSFIREKYLQQTNAVLITTYSSNSSGTCDLYAGAPTSQTQSLSLSEQIETRSATSNMNTQKIELSPTKVYPNSIKLNSDINITSGDLIESIDIYSLSGQKLKSFPIKGNQVKLFTSDMNISQTGIYILRIKTSSGIKTEKVIIN